MGYEPSDNSSDGEQPEYVREIDDHTGVADSFGTPYTYEHVEESPGPDAEVYRVTAFIDYANRPIHKNVYYVEAHRLDDFFVGYAETFEQVVDARPLSYAEAEREFTEFGDE